MAEMKSVPSPTARIARALEIADRYGTIDGAHHKQWVIDQMIRALLGPDYDVWVHKVGAGPWDTGKAP